jgi:hypothetical protein
MEYMAKIVQKPAVNVKIIPPVTRVQDFVRMDVKAPGIPLDVTVCFVMY